MNDCTTFSVVPLVTNKNLNNVLFRYFIFRLNELRRDDRYLTSPQKQIFVEKKNSIKNVNFTQHLHNQRPTISPYTLP